MEHIIRDIEINKVLELPLTGDSKIVVDFFDNLFSKLTIKTLDDNPNVIYMMVGDELFMEQKFENGEPTDHLWCRYNGYWEFFETQLKLNYNETKGLIKYVVEEQLKSKGIAPYNTKSVTEFKVEEQLKSKGIAPLKVGSINSLMVEEQLKSKGIAPSATFDTDTYTVEEQLKSKGIAPLFLKHSNFSMVEEQLKSKGIVPRSVIGNSNEAVEEQLKSKGIDIEN